MIVIKKPPSLNQIYRFSSKGGFARSYITQKGQDWFVSSAQTVAKEHSFGKKFPLQGKISLTIVLYTARFQDVDNILKPILDLLSSTCLICYEKHSAKKYCACHQNKSLIANDEQVYKLCVEKHKVAHLPEERVEIEISEDNY